MASYRTFAAFADRSALAHEDARESTLAELTADEYVEHLRTWAPFAGALPLLEGAARDSPSAPSLLQDVCLVRESSRDSWLRTRGTDIDPRDLAEDAPVAAGVLDGELAAAARSAAFLRAFALSVSQVAGSSVVLILNARGATPYSYAFGDCPRLGGQEMTKAGAASQPVIVLADMKISSHEYVCREEQALLLSGTAPWRTKMRPSFADAVAGAEHVPDSLAGVLEAGVPVIFADIPTWGSAYSSSAGLDRKMKDRAKWAAGVRRPFKMKSYADFAGYQTFAFSAAKYAKAVEDPIFLGEELLDRPWPDRVCWIVNPRAQAHPPVWDNRPQLLGGLGLRYSPLRDGDGFTIREHGTVRHVAAAPPALTTHGQMPVAEYVRRRVSALAEEYRDSA